MILAEIITFNPDIDILKKNILAIYQQVEKLVIVDNNSNNVHDIEILTSSISRNIEIIKNNENYGIAKALNQGLKKAESENYDWLLTLDQDSLSDAKLVQSLVEYIDKKDNTIVLAPKIVDLNMKKHNELKQKNRFNEVDFAITSGSLIDVKKAILIDGFDDDLFIDYVDFDFCLKSRKNGFKILKIENAVLFHRLGEITEHKILGIKVVVTNHSALRRYYLYRNKIILYKRYFNDEKKWVFKNILSSIKVFLIICLFEKNKKEKIQKIFLGIKSGIIKT